MMKAYFDQSSGKLNWVLKEQPLRHARYCYIMPTPLPPSNMQWHRWFAWRPVVIYSRAGNPQLVWLVDVERKRTLGNTSGLEPRWILSEGERSGRVSGLDLAVIEFFNRPWWPETARGGHGVS
jgi:hypothetical protein